MPIRSPARRTPPPAPPPLRRRPRPRLGVLEGLVALGLASASLAGAPMVAVGHGCAHAQAPGPRRAAADTADPADGGRRDGTAGRAVSGTIVDGVTGDPVAGATVVLQPEVLGAFPGPAVGSGFATASRSVLSDPLGAYRFDGLPAGVYRLYVSRYGYRPFSVVIELATAGETEVGIGLGARPVALEPVRGRSRARGPFEAAHWFDRDPAAARLLVTDLRRRRFLTTDVRELTHVDVVEAVTLGEPDLFRALQRLPGVTSRSDYTAELWTRGAPWAHTRVYFDGVPLFNPLHALGVISGIGSAATGAVWFHPGARTAAMGEGAAGVVDLRSRRAAGGGELNVSADLSLLSASIALDQRVADGRAGWMLSGRRTYLDWLSSLAARATGREHESVPYGFSELTGRVDAQVSPVGSLEASWLWEGDHLTSSPAGEGNRARAEWGNRVGHASWSTRTDGVALRHGVGFSRLDGRADPETSTSAAWPETGAETAVRYAGFTGSITPEAVSLAGPAWAVGYGFEHHSAEYRGPVPLPVPRSGSLAGTWAGPAAEHAAEIARWSASLPLAVVWGEGSWIPDDRLAIRAGLRVEASRRLANAPAVRPAPRLAVRYAPRPELALSAGYSRVYQYTQSVAPAGVHVASLVSADAWLVAGKDVPVLGSDILTAGVEAWLAPGRVLAVNAFGRIAAGVAMPDPRPGPVFGRHAFVVGENVAYGVEASLRQLVGPVTGSFAYTLTRSGMSAVGHTFRAPGDRSHVLNAAAMLRVTPSLRLGAAFTAATGVPYTPVIADSAACAGFAGCDPERLPWAGDPHSDRAPPFASLDLLVDWTSEYRGVEVGVYAQLRNALDHDNATVYTGPPARCAGGGCDTNLGNAYERGIPRLPVLGFRVRF